MSIYEKLQKMRVELQEKKLKMSGENKFAKFKYYELKDILPAINKLCLENRVVTQFYIDSDIAYLEIKNIDQGSGEKIIFKVPFVLPEIKGANKVQNLGGAITYLRRYLFLTAFEIIEDDTSDAIIGQQENTGQKKTYTINQKQLKLLNTRMNQHGWTPEKMKEYCKNKYNIESSKELNNEQLNDILKVIETDIPF